MATISKSKNHFTLIIVFTIKPENADKLLNYLIEVTEETMCKIDGYVSCNFHLSEDRTKVAEYVQWESKEHYEAMRDNPEATEHMDKTLALTEDFELTVYDVIWSD